jgi:hypothetical protein
LQTGHAARSNAATAAMCGGNLLRNCNNHKYICLRYHAHTFTDGHTCFVHDTAE